MQCTTTFLGMDGQNCTPDGLQFFQRLTRKITAQLLADQNFDIFSLKPELEEKLEQFRNREAIPDFDIGSEEFDIEVQVNLCQNYLFTRQLTHNMTKDCSMIYQFCI